MHFPPFTPPSHPHPYCRRTLNPNSQVEAPWMASPEAKARAMAKPAAYDYMQILNQYFLQESQKLVGRRMKQIREGCATSPEVRGMGQDQRPSHFINDLDLLVEQVLGLAKIDGSTYRALSKA